MSPQHTPPPSWGRRAAMYAIAFTPPLVLYKVAESMARGAGYGRWAAVGWGSLGALAGALVAGALLMLLVRLWSPKKDP